MSANNDGSESVDQFLARIASIKEGKSDPNAASRRMDEEFLKGRQERQARRLERARSISPSKTGPARPLSSSKNAFDTAPSSEQALNPPVDFSPQAKSLSRTNAVSGRTSPVRDTESASSRPASLSSKTEDAKPTASGLARSGTLSWQQRRDGPRQRPLSGFATVRSISREPEEDSDRADMTRNEIAASLASKDPTWFRQTQDRGVGSAAFRKSQVEEVSETLSSKSMQLPGMAQFREPSKSPVPEAREDTTSTPQKLISIRDSSPRFARGTTPDIAALRESMAEKPPSLRPSSQDTFSSRPTSSDTLGLDDSTTTLARSSSSLAQNRPPSPTKGLGGFVESAMMKRSDSVNKRWSVKSNTGLVRGDSVAGARPRSLHSRGLSRDVPAMRGDTPSSPLAASRPGSSYSQTADLSSQVPEKLKLDVNQELKATEPQTQNPSIEARPQTPTEDAFLARSPSKTMDPRRWSPTKSTWLETALQQQTEPPKLQPLKEEQPKWKIDLQRSKSKASRDISPEKGSSLLQKIDPSSKNDTPTQPKSVSPTIRQKACTEASTTIRTNAEPSTSAQSVETKSVESNIKPEPTIETETAKIADTKQAPEPSQKPVQKDFPALVKQAPALKPKPQTPPKTDFRATLKSRTAGPTQTTDSEPEFKSMFGKLKRTTTQNYVAPDELKTNILTGKAALSVTGGPVKTTRVDEFKESILAKKDEMKTAPSKPSSVVEPRPRTEEPIPEALARRKTLSKASAPDLSSLRRKPDSKPDLPVKLVTSKSTESNSKSPDLSSVVTMRAETLSKPVPAKTSMGAQESKLSSKATDNDNTPSPPLQDQSATSSPIFKTKSLPAVMSRVENQNQTRTKSPELPRQSNTFPLADAVKPSSTAAQPVAGKLASRLNPNLAAMLSRGPSPKPPTASRENDTDNQQATSQSSTSKGASNDDAGLTHMTKGRAKGPKRRAPKAEAKADTTIPPKTETKPESKSESNPEPKVVPKIKPKVEAKSSPKPEPQPEAIQTPSQPVIAVTKTSNVGLSLPQIPKADSASPKPARDSKQAFSSLGVPRDQEESPLKELQQPKTPSKPSELADVATDKTNAVSNEQKIPSSIEKPRPVVASKSPGLRRVSGTPTPSRLSFDPKPATPPKPAPTFITPKSKTVLEQEVAALSKPNKTEPVASSNVNEASKTSIRPISSKPKPSFVQGLGLQMNPTPQAIKMPAKSRELTPPPDEEIKMSKVRQSGNVKSLLESYVGNFPSENERADFDSQHFLAGVAQEQPKIKTLQHSIVEVSGDGKRSELPSQQQPILFEESMYLTTHKFSTDDGAISSEVQLWCGDRVADAAIDDAQIFCRRTAREHNVKLEVIKQGRESSAFIAGLGGILIIRRTKSSALYMLCGRQHLGHIVFDEVDMTQANLCPGFVYLVSAPYGKLFLWKGNGAGVNEISSAKLIGTDLGLTGEIEEIEQGKEPSQFWEGVDKSRALQYSRTWDSKNSSKRHQTILYRIGHERPGMLTNLASWGLKRAASPAKQQTKATCEYVQPFTQTDLEHPSIHIVDAYHSLYIIITRQCASKAAEFITSMHLTQDFAMLSPAIQDRPVLPTCYVVAGELPQDVKICFRKWSNIEASSLLGQGSLCVRLEEVMEAVGL